MSHLWENQFLLYEQNTADKPVSVHAGCWLIIISYLNVGLMVGKLDFVACEQQKFRSDCAASVWSVP